MSWDTNSNTSFQQPPVGSHVAVLIKVIDIGTQEGEWKGEKTNRRQNILTWELPYELTEDGQPFIISKFYTASIGEKSNLYKDLTSWFGKPPTPPMTNEKIKALLGKGCQIVVSERENSDKKVVSAVVGLAKGTNIPAEPHNPQIFFSLDEYDEAVFDNLSDGLQKMIMKSPEYAKIISGDVVDEPAGTDDIPF